MCISSETKSIWMKLGRWVDGEKKSRILDGIARVPNSGPGNYFFYFGKVYV